MELTLEKESLEKEVKTPDLIQYANALEIHTHNETIAAQETLKEIKRRQRIVKERLEPIRDNTYRAWKSVCDLLASFINPLEAIERIIKKKCSDFQDEIDREFQEEARRAEAKRLEEERKRREELERQAKAAEEKGKTEKAEALREKAENVAVAPVFTPPPPPKAQGTIFKKVWKARVTNWSDLFLSIHQGKAPANLLTINQSALNAFAKGVKNTMPVPGIEFYEETDMSVRA